MNLDKIDRSILYELDKSARLSARQIARKLRTAKEVVQYRIKRLEKKGIIQGYYALIDPATLGYTMVRIYLKLQHETPDIRDAILNDFVAEKGSFLVYHSDFAWDVAGGFAVPSLKEFDAVWQDIRAKYKQYIADAHISPIFELTLFPRKYLSPRPVTSFTALSNGLGKKQQLEHTDLKLLGRIAADARASLVTVARDLDLSSAAVLYRLRRLEKKKIILGYKAIINFTKYGYEYYKADISLEDGTLRDKIRSYLHHCPNVTYEDRTVGGSDIEVDMELPDYRSFFHLMEELKQRFPNAIRGYTFYRLIKVHKTKYLPDTLNYKLHDNYDSGEGRHYGIAEKASGRNRDRNL
jgi:DNA-binding Lrp family transcriptional regulator